ncbi:MAG: hypothetical protein FD163_2092 [Hyphomonadaceae bacterium]|nr:MAG: hypothetical protein FD128_678 [Hyphomonadaceae bacterium]KAF0183898.1 MAG: hypothetical protein FD163_2092 [Hyphomonadaceae bacterium]
MALYYYTNYKYGIENIEKKRVKISTFETLNDPFELATFKQTKDMRNSLKLLRESIAKKRGLVCLSRTWKDPLMWGHYGDRFTGICLGFDVLGHERKLLKVDYEMNRRDPGELDVKDFSNPTFWEARRLLKTKYEKWEYEQEERLILTLVDHEKEIVEGKDGENGTDLYFKKFDSEFKLVEVIFSQMAFSRWKMEENKFKYTAKNFLPEIEFKVARAAYTKYDIRKNRTLTPKLQTLISV